MTGAVDRLLGSMSLREKVGRLNQRLFGWECAGRVDGRWRLTDAFRAELDRWDGIGALYGLFRSDPWSGRSEECLGESPLLAAEMAVTVRGMQGPDRSAPRPPLHGCR